MRSLLKEAVKEAATVEEAKRAVAAELGMAEEKLQFEVLQMPQKKTLGLFGGCPARVRGFIEITPAATAAAYLDSLLKAMGVAGTAIAIQEKENGCVLTLEGDEDLGFIIGRRGDTLDALQYLTGLVANRVDNAYYRVTIDIGNYREKREQALAGLAKKVAGQAARTGRRTSLEPMNPYERRIIHTAVQEIEGATSWSVGSEPNRHVIIGPSDDNPAKAVPFGRAGPPGRRPRATARSGREDGGAYREAGAAAALPVRIGRILRRNARCGSLCRGANRCPPPTVRPRPPKPNPKKNRPPRFMDGLTCKFPPSF